METRPEQAAVREIKERGSSNVSITLKILRHGEREGLRLNELGRETTKQRATHSGAAEAGYDAVKAIGSDADPDPESGIGRGLETADIYSHTVAGDQAFNTRPNESLDYHNLVSTRPYDHQTLYNFFLPENFSALTKEQKAEASKIANRKVLDYLVELDTPETDQFKKEAAGTYAHLVDHYMKVAKRLKSGSKILIPAGAHSSVMEFFLLKALAHHDPAGNTVIGFNNLEEIGGDFDPSEAYNIEIATDEQGNFKPLKVTFDNPNRPQGEMHIDPTTMRDLLKFYLSLHPEVK